MRLLLVEDDLTLGATLHERLKKEGHSVLWAQDYKQASERIDNEGFDLALFDVGLPDGSGFELAKKLRSKSAIPFIFMTAASDAENRLEGFEIGAEEFIPKPFHLRELLLRVSHVLENHMVPTKVNLPGLDVDFESMMVRFGDGKTTELSQKENQILKILVEASPEVVSREQILNTVWGEDKFPSNRTVDNIVVKLRQILGGEHDHWIQSVRGVGYRWYGKE